MERFGVPPLRAGRRLSNLGAIRQCPGKGHSEEDAKDDAKDNAKDFAQGAAQGRVKTCACTGVRWCARCRDPELRRLHGLCAPLTLPTWLMDALAVTRRAGCGGWEPTGHGLRAGLSTASTAAGLHFFDPDLQGAPSCPEFRGVRVYPNALRQAEAESIRSRIEASPFLPSQSGKQKQHFGPRFNFMRRRMNAERFTGLPDYAGWLEERMRTLVAADRAGEAGDLEACRRALAEYRTTDVFVLRYFEREQSNLDFHVDDLFAYGEAIVDVSLDSDSFLTFLGPVDSTNDSPYEGAPPSPDTATGLACVRVHLPARSLAIVYGSARFDWQHAILPDDIRGIRTSITLRTLAPALRATDSGRAVLTRATGSLLA